MYTRLFAILIVAALVIGISGNLLTCPADERIEANGTTVQPAYTAADIVVEYRDASGRSVKPHQKFRVEDAEDVARLAAHLPGVLDDRGSGPRQSAEWKSRFTILLHHRSGDKGQMRAVHVSPDYSFWTWRDNTPFTGPRPVEGKDKLRELIERLAAKHKVDLK